MTRTCERCPRAVPRRRHRYCSDACAAAGNQARRRMPLAPKSRASALAYELRREVPAHLCIYCERPLRGIQRLVCGERECRALYLNDFKRAQRALDLRLVAEARRQAAEART